MQGTVLREASRQWASRPNDERYLSLSDLGAAVKRRRVESWTVAPALASLRVHGSDDGYGVMVDVVDPTKGVVRSLAPSHWAFGQLASAAGAPAGYLRKLPAELASINLQWGLEHNGAYESGDALLLAQSNGSDNLRAVTSRSYGRIWDAQVVDAVQRVNADGRWKVPAASYASTNPKLASTLYASDHDCFIFLVDDSRPIEVAGRTYFRGFYCWNSEVGACTFGLCTFLYDRVYDNRTIWGAIDVREVRIVHRGGAPERFAYEGRKFLERYSEASADRIVETIKRADQYVIPGSDERAKSRDNVVAWLSKRGFTRGVALGAVASSVAERGEAPRTLLQAVNGLTAHARSIEFADDRVAVESKAGDLLALVA